MMLFAPGRSNEEAAADEAAARATWATPPRRSGLDYQGRYPEHADIPAPEVRTRPTLRERLARWWRDHIIADL